jgi:hypothetical protein
MQHPGGNLAKTSLLFAVLLLTPLPALSQPLLQFKRVIANWPTIELYFNVSCNGENQWEIGKEHLRVRENGQEVEEFTLWCPPARSRCPFSLALVVDGSGSMRGEPVTRIREHLHAFRQMMDGELDETAVLTAGRFPRITQGFTTDQQLLEAAIDDIRPGGGGAALYDGVMKALHLMTREGFNSCRAIVLCTDGWDNASDASLQEVIAFANRNRIRVFVIGEGMMPDENSLFLLAHLTGARYQRTPGPGHLASIMQEITTSMWWPHHYECIITYERVCADGSMRNVELEVRDFCDGGDTRNKTYKAPVDSSTFVYQHLRVGESVSAPAGEVAVPLLLDALPGGGLLRPFDISIRHDGPSRPFLDVTIPANSPLEGILLRTDQIVGGGVRIRLEEQVPVSETASLLELRCSTGGLYDSSWFALTASATPVDDFCVVTQVGDGGYGIVPRLLPRLAPEGEVWICPDAGLEITANPGFASWRWSTGDTTRSIIVRSEGSYFVDVVDEYGDTLRSDPLRVYLRPRRNVWIEPSGPLTFCRQESVTLRVAGDTAGTHRYWLHESRPRDVLTARISGLYWAMVQDEHGCMYSTDTVAVTVNDPPVTLNIRDDNVRVCPRDSIELRVEEFYPVYSWSTGESTRAVTVGAGRYWVKVIDAQGCESRSHSIDVLEHLKRTVRISPAEHLILCRGEEITLTVEEEFLSCRWSTGAHTREIHVSEAGVYSVVGRDSVGCSVISDEVMVELVDTPAPLISPVRFTSICDGAPVMLDAGPGFASYLWSTGDTTRMLETADTGSYTVTVTAYGGCSGQSAPFTVRAETLDPPVISHEGLPALCPGDTLVLHAPAGFADYIWSTGARTQSIVVDAEGEYTVNVLSTGGCEAVSSPVRVRLWRSGLPGIEREGNVLRTTEAVLAHQWFLEGVAIPGATGAELVLPSTGRYRVRVIDSCHIERMSEELLVSTLNAAQPPERPRIALFPEPNDGMLHVHIDGARGKVTAELYDLLGRLQTRAQLLPVADGTVREILDFRASPRGLYLLRLSHPDGVTVRRVLRH